MLPVGGEVAGCELELSTTRSYHDTIEVQQRYAELAKWPTAVHMIENILISNSLGSNQAHCLRSMVL